MTTGARASLAILVSSAALALAACSGPSSPHVASLGKSSGSRDGSTTTTQPTGNPTQLLDDWAVCMRSHGDPNQADPTVDANKDIEIIWNPAITGGYYGTNKGGQGNSGPGQYCRAYLSAAQTALGGNQEQPHSDPATLEKLSACMRANGISDFPDPSGDTLSFNVGAGGDLSPTNPTFQNAAKLCAQKTGRNCRVWAAPPSHRESSSSIAAVRSPTPVRAPMAEFTVGRAARTHRRWGGLAILVAAAALGLAACSGGASDLPHVASLGTDTSSNTSGSSHGSTTTVPKAGNPTQLMDEWAACMRSNGDPNQTDPTIDAYGVINITMQDVSQAIASEAHGSSGPCSLYELAAENALRGGQQYQPPDQTQMVQYTDCMRTHGVPNYPDPGSNGKTDFNGTGVDPNSPFVENANKVCGKEINAPAWWIAGTGPPGDVVVTSCSGVPNCHPPGEGGPIPRNTATVVPGTNGGSGANG